MASGQYLEWGLDKGHLCLVWPHNHGHEDFPSSPVPLWLLHTPGPHLFLCCFIRQKEFHYCDWAPQIPIPIQLLLFSDFSVLVCQLFQVIHGFTLNSSHWRNRRSSHISPLPCGWPTANTAKRMVLHKVGQPAPLLSSQPSDTPTPL